MSWNKKTHTQFIKELEEKRPDLQVNGEYTTSKVKLRFICTEGHEWSATPSHILNDNTPCPTCSNNEQSIRRSKNKDDFIKGMLAVNSHMTLIGDYKNAKTKVKVICPVGHVAYCSPGNILKGSGCRECVDYGKFRDAPITLYYIKILHEGKNYYKIGLTQRGVSRRFVGAEGTKITSLYEEVYDSPLLAWEAEQSLIRVFKEFIIKGKVLRNGNTEIFCCDVLHMDNMQKESLWL